MVKNKKKALWITLTSVFSVLFVALIVGTIIANYFYVIVDRVLNTPRTVIKYYDEDGNEVDGSEYTEGKFLSEFSSESERIAEQTKVSEQLVAEGSVLLKNENGALPLAKGSKVSTFNQASVDMIYGSVGSGAIDTSKSMTLKDSLTDAGLKVNEKLWSVYQNSGKKRKVPGVAGGSDSSFAVNELGWTRAVSGAVSKEYGDAAIVVLARTGGEGSDWAQNMKNNAEKEFQTADENHASLLSLTDQEKQTFEELGKLKKNGTIKKIVVLVNSSNPMELGFLDDASYGIDAALWVGNVGQKGMSAVGDILVGDVNPSGRLMDTYASCALSAPSVENSGDFTFENKTGVNSGTKYLVEEEGIYIGYRYYETRYEDCVTGKGNASSTAGAFDSEGNWNYAEEVVFPFGYGMSYTKFVYSDFKAEETENGFKLSVNVKNEGSVAGKDVVQFYFQSPYTEYDKENDVEKASVELCGFDKTETLEPGDDETVTVTVSKDELRAYDYVNAKSYILDAGDYYFAFGTDAHDALNNVLGAKGYSVSDGMTENGNDSFVWKWNNAKLDTEIFKNDGGADIGNLFDSASLEYYGLEQNVLSRSDWKATYPTPYKGKYHSDGKTLTANEKMITDLKDEYVRDTSVTKAPDMGKTGTAKLVDAKGKAYDDEIWNDILDQLTWDEMVTLVATSGYSTAAISKIDKPYVVDSDGPAGISGELYGGESGMGFPSEVVLSSTWNLDLIERMGEMVGEDGLAIGVTGWYAPAVNIHRNAFAGRNYEYYSEDPFLSGKAAAAETKGVQSKGMYVYVKHFAFNDQETNRIGVATFAFEQAMREIYLEPFEIAVQEGEAHGIMTSFNRVGCQWTGASYNLLTKVLRDEWGFVGHVITDFSGLSSSYMRIDVGLKAGNDCWLSTSATYEGKLNAYKDDPAMATYLREATHRILYSTANSAAMNPYIVESGITAKTIDVTPWWETALIVIDVVLGVAAVGSAAMLVISLKKGSKKEEAKTASEE